MSTSHRGGILREGGTEGENEEVSERFSEIKYLTRSEIAFVSCTTSFKKLFS